MLTEKQKTIISVLKQYGCCTTNDVIRLAKRHNYNTDTLTTGSVAGILRTWISKGLAANADNGNNKKVYWLTDFGKEFFSK